MSKESANQTQVVILGAGGTGLYMAESVDRVHSLGFLGFLDDDPQKQAEGYCGRPVLGAPNSWPELSAECLFLTSLYGPKKNPFYFQLIESLGIPASRWATVVDPHAFVSPTASIGLGSYIAPGTILEPMACLGRFCGLFGNVYIAHHSRLSDYVCCANSVSIAGGVSVGAQTYIGGNSTIREYTKIGSRSVVGMGSVVLEDVKDGMVVVGNPARIMQQKKSE